MSDIAIRVEGLSKQYSIGEQERYKALRDVITDAASAPFRRLRSAFDRRSQTVNGNASQASLAPNGSRSSLAGQPSDDGLFWALKDVSFEVSRGEVVGIIGRNGAGKSTLLRILSRITKPTSGHAEIHGRVGSLLEVGTGFHPELTGRENIYLNAAILGMRKAEVARKFDEIVAFAEVEKFIDTPVKRYSSGMYVRLAFAVAAHMETEVLLVDEVLAVGDVVFQEKCLGKMKQVSHSQGRTIVFVSHNMNAIQSLCRSAVVLDSGMIDFKGEVENAVGRYFTKAKPQTTIDQLKDCLRTGTGEARVISVRFEDDSGTLQTHFRMGEPLNIIVQADFQREIKNPTFGINIMTDSGILVADCRSSHYDLKIGTVKNLVEYRMRIEAVSLYPRTYWVEPWLTDSRCLEVFDWAKNVASLVITSGSNFKKGDVNSSHGISYIPTIWSAGEISKIDR